jgi:enamine deaminase RidA (YjgF/YER057c/UK114 family)
MAKDVRAVNPPTLMKPSGFSHGYEVTAGKTFYIAGQIAKDKDGQLIGAGDIVAQFRQVCENIRLLLASRGAQMTDVVKLTIYVLDVPGYKARLKELGPVYREYFGKHFPAMTLVGARDLFDAADGAMIEIEGIAIV